MQQLKGNTKRGTTEPEYFMKDIRLRNRLSRMNVIEYEA